MSDDIPKVWAVYSRGVVRGCVDGIGKIVKQRDTGSYDILYEEKQQLPPELWDPKYIKTFADPLRAIAYFLVHQNPLLERAYTKREVINAFLEKFSTERKNIEGRVKFISFSSKMPIGTLFQAANDSWWKVQAKYACQLQ